VGRKSARRGSVGGAAPGFAGRVRERAPAREMRLPPFVRAQLDAWGKIIEQIGLQPE
jgi:hypothetical protein